MIGENDGRWVTIRGRHVFIKYKDMSEDDKVRVAMGLQPRHVGKHAVVKNSDLKNGLPIKGEPDSIVDKVDDSGKVLQRRYYGHDGMAVYDIDVTDHKQSHRHPMGAHKHVYTYGKKVVHGKPMSLTEEDLKNNSDIVQEGVNYHDKR